jgi:hypothetical protein
MPERAPRVDVRQDNAFVQRCEKCNKDRHRRLSILQEAAVSQLFLQFTSSTIDTRSTSLRLINAEQKPLARTLSRKFWQ